VWAVPAPYQVKALFEVMECAFGAVRTTIVPPPLSLFTYWAAY